MNPAAQLSYIEDMHGQPRDGKLPERIVRTDQDGECVQDSSSDHESSTSDTPSSKNGYLVTPPSASRVSRISSMGGLSPSGSIPPFRKIANKITGSKQRNSPGSMVSVSPLIVTKKASPPSNKHSSDSVNDWHYASSRTINGYLSSMVSNHFIIFNDAFFVTVPSSYSFVNCFKDTIKNATSLSGCHSNNTADKT